MRTTARRLTAAAFTATLLAAGCTSDAPRTTSVEPIDPPVTSVPRPVDPTLPVGAFGESRLTFFGDCEALGTHMREIATARVTPWGLGGGWGPWDPWGPIPAFENDAMADAADGGFDAPVGAPATTTPEFSGTNVQEVGVDEGDVVETDGRYVYSVTDGVLRIVEVAGARVVATPDLPSGDHQLLLDGDRLLVATSGWTGGGATTVSVFDVTDPAAPRLLQRTQLEGRLVASRSIDGVVRLVLSSSFDARLPFVDPSMFGFDEAGALARNREIIATSAVEEWLPRRFEITPDGSFGPMTPALDCSTVAAPPRFSGLGVSWIATVDLRTDALPVGSAGIVSEGETVYASPSSLFVATVPWDPIVDEGDPEPASSGPWMPWAPSDETTLIHAFSLGSGGSAQYTASGEVPGTLLNQFAMSEHEGVLRVATTEHRWDAARSTSSVHLLEPRDGQLVELAMVEGLGFGERIYAVRFMGPTAYIVTFREIDPLYVLDLSDPRAPVLQGELKIPGYSAYLHPVGEGLLLGVGQDADESGWALGTQLSLFDVSVPTDPQRIGTLPIGGWSEVEWDHRAFLFWPADGTIVLPVSPGWGRCPAGAACLADGIRGPGGGAVVARLVDRELIGVGVIEHTDTDPWSGCWNPLQRSIVIGSELVTVGLDQMRFSDRTSLAERATTVWGGADRCTWWWD